MIVTNSRKVNAYYEALVNRDQSFVGIFYVGVKTTSIFCIATCRARKPKFENVEFFTKFKDALEYGYRPCKICKPTENAQAAPAPVELAIKMVKENPKEKLTDARLRESSISPELVRRWFKKNYGMTFQTFQRMYRVNNAFLELKSGKSATTAAYDTGYESLSGFGYTFKKLIGNSPQNSKADSVILINRLTTPLGPMFICATANGICLLEFVNRKELESEFKDLQRLLKARIIMGDNEHIDQAKKEIAEYFAGDRQTFTLKLVTPGTGFQQAVWKGLLAIPYGEVSNYQKQAERINKPKAVRAVAAANGRNRIAIIIPCHRVIGKNGALTGYSGGIERKRWLIDHEQEQLS